MNLKVQSLSTSIGVILIHVIKSKKKTYLYIQLKYETDCQGHLHSHFNFFSNQATFASITNTFTAFTPFLNKRKQK